MDIGADTDSVEPFLRQMAALDEASAWAGGGSAPGEQTRRRLRAPRGGLEGAWAQARAARWAARYAFQLGSLRAFQAGCACGARHHGGDAIDASCMAEAALAGLRRCLDRPGR